jgi:diguanylate cyclase (GGDEF)-like protein
MNSVLNGIADFCRLRDRDAMDAAWVGLVMQVAQGEVRTARFVQLVGEQDDLRCRVTVEQTRSASVLVASPGLMDWHRFEALASSPHRQMVLTKGLAHAVLDQLHVNVLALESPPHVLRMLELVSDADLSSQCRGAVDALVRIYRSQETLLDYGERDTLTELLNRKTFDGAFQKVSVERMAQVDPARQERRHPHAHEGYWLAVLDIDHFKRVNDNFGHLIGDEVLLLLARAMRASFRFHDQLYRFGGEEFVVLMRCAHAGDAHAALERFRRTIETHDFPQVGRITVSIGYSALQVDDTPGGAFDRADKAVYFAKGNGRNQVCSFEDLVARGLLAESVQESKEADFF